MALAMMFKCIKILGDTTDQKMIKAKKLPKHPEKRREKWRKRKEKEDEEKKKEREKREKRKILEREEKKTN